MSDEFVDANAADKRVRSRDLLGFIEVTRVDDGVTGHGAPISVVIEEFVGGRIYETDVDGRTCDWGKVLEFEAGKHLRILWQVGRPEALASELDVRFESLTNESCRVVLVHEHWERLGERAVEVRQEYESGWDIVFGKLYAARADRA